ncbi:hypothetical protein [Anaeromyxobacter diazotrophicus]|uniref:Lipoprotein n=1 Tax=Anaeromyxobacter diazotrophicus TaxID=2590199 RepID=A0A7I9VS20_9BACT|nr:hypothetical protein [Anaeromyxobacter diazotrophicus]GEJ58717.1 hypothetical protein AMYX_34580 [Anaeromyxobacter diazotrophicus]
MTTRLALAAVAAAVLATVAGCGSACQDLGERICGCQPAGTLRDNCNSSIRNELGSSYGQASKADQAFCQAKLATCPDFAAHPDECPVLNTAAGMQECGLAYPTAAAP